MMFLQLSELSVCLFFNFKPKWSIFLISYSKKIIIIIIELVISSKGNIH